MIVDLSTVPGWEGEALPEDRILRVRCRTPRYGEPHVVVTLDADSDLEWADEGKWTSERYYDTDEEAWAAFRALLAVLREARDG